MHPSRLVVTAAVLAFTAGGAQAQVINGSFEVPIVPYGNFQSYGENTNLGGWIVESGSIDVVGGGYWQAADGNQSIDLNGNVPARIYQNVTVGVGTTYDLFFSMAGNPELANPGLAGPRTMEVFWGALNGSLISIGEFVFDRPNATRANMMWEQHSVTGLLATEGTMRLVFQSTTLNTPFNGPALDGVSLIQSSSTVPEPISMTLMATGLLGVGALKRRRRTIQSEQST